MLEHCTALDANITIVEEIGDNRIHEWMQDFGFHAAGKTFDPAPFPPYAERSYATYNCMKITRMYTLAFLYP